MGNTGLCNRTYIFIVLCYVYSNWFGNYYEYLVFISLAIRFVSYLLNMEEIKAHIKKDPILTR